MEARRATACLELNLAGGERFILHDDSAAGGQDHDVELLLALVCLLVPLASHFCVMGRNQRHLNTKASGDFTFDGGKTETV